MEENKIKEDKVWGSKIINYFRTRKLINIHIINNKIAIINGNTSDWMSKIPTFQTLKPELKELIGDTFELKTLEKYGNKREAYDYVKKHHPELTIYPDGAILLGEEAYYKTLVQIHPTEDIILVVYPSVYGFCSANKISVTQVEKALQDQTLLSGYRWQTFFQYDYPVTALNQIYQDPLNLGFHFVVKNHKRGKAQEVIRIDKQGNTKEYESAVKAWEDLGKGNLTNMRIYMKQNKPFHGYIFKYK
jgi:hypothetical protein